MRVFVGGFFVFCFQACFVLSGVGESFSEPKEFTDFESNLGEQRLVDVVKPWVGVTPQELVSDSVVLGSLKGRTYVPAEDLAGESEPLVPVSKKEEDGLEKKIEQERVELPEDITYLLNITGEPLPVNRTAEGWVGPLPHELAPVRYVWARWRTVGKFR